MTPFEGMLKRGFGSVRINPLMSLSLSNGMLLITFEGLPGLDRHSRIINARIPDQIRSEAASHIMDVMQLYVEDQLDALDQVTYGVNISEENILKEGFRNGQN